MRTMVLALVLCLPAGATTMTDIMDPGAQIEKVAGGFKFTEGPVWSAKGYLLFSDTPADSIYQYTPGKGISTFRKPSRQSNGLTFDRQGRLIACESEGQVTRTERDGRLTTLAQRFEGKVFNSPNDVAVRSDGTVFFTDPSYNIGARRAVKPGEPEIGHRGLYRIGRDGSVALLDKDFAQPNGVCLSPDEKRLYVDDTERGLIRMYDLQPDGSVRNARTFAELKAPGQDGAPDGMKTDRKGNVFCTGPGAVWVFSPDGALLGKISPPEVAANVAFGDRDMKTLYMTARTGLYRVRLKVAGKR